jgi:hypothetical protein
MSAIACMMGRVAQVGDDASQSIGEAESPFGRCKQDHAAVRAITGVAALALGSGQLMPDFFRLYQCACAAHRRIPAMRMGSTGGPMISFTAALRCLTYSAGGERADCHRRGSATYAAARARADEVI